MVVTKIDSAGFETEEDYFLYSEVRQLYYLTYYGYLKAKKGQKNESHQNTTR